MDYSYNFHFTNLNKNLFMIIKILALSQFISILLLEKNLYYTDIIPTLIIQGDSRGFTEIG